MLDDDKTTTDEPTADAADEAVAEPAAAVEPKAEEVVKDAPVAQSAGTDQQGRTLYNVKCSNCGKDTQVPFQPSGDRPVYCRDCYMQKKNSQG